MTARIALAAFFIVPAAMAYPWHTVSQRWLLGIAIAVVIVVFAWWRGQFATDVLRHRLAIWRRNHSGGALHQTRPADHATALLAVDGPEPGDLPVPLIAGYVQRYGLRCEQVRITSRDIAGERSTWIGLTLNAADNLPALLARSPRIPLQDTADILARRLADQLREDGWSVSPVEGAAAPETGAESWRSVAVDAGYSAAYQIPLTDLDRALPAVWSYSSEQTWVAVEFGNGTAAAVCAFYTKESPGKDAPVPGLVSLGGRQGPTLHALAPDSGESLPGHTATGADLQWWPVSSDAQSVG